MASLQRAVALARITAFPWSSSSTCTSTWWTLSRPRARTPTLAEPGCRLPPGLGKGRTQGGEVVHVPHAATRAPRRLDQERRPEHRGLPLDLLIGHAVRVDPAQTGTSTSRATARAAVLSPSRHIASGRPTKSSPASRTRSAKPDPPRGTRTRDAPRRPLRSSPPGRAPRRRGQTAPARRRRRPAGRASRSGR